MRLFIRILSATDAPDRSANRIFRYRWLARDDLGRTVGQGQADADALGDIVDALGDAGVSDAASVLADPDNIVVLVPSAEVALLSCTVPGRRPPQIRRALPFAVEEFLTQDVESMHLAHGPIVRGQPVRCALIDSQLMADWLARLREGGLQPGHMVPDAHLLPCDDHSASVLFDDGEALARTPGHIASVQASTLPDILESIRASFGETDEPLGLELIGGGDLSEEQAALGGFSVRRTLLNGAVIEFLASRWTTNRPQINLLQGVFAPPRGGGAASRGWRSVGALAVLWLLVTLAWLITEGYVANYRADALETESTDLYRSIYPNERRVPNAYAQMRAKLRQSDFGQAAFHLLLGQLAGGTTQGNVDIDVRSITFNDARGELTSDLWLSGYAQIDALKRELEQRGLTVDISSAEERDSIVRARLRMSLSGRPQE